MLQNDLDVPDFGGFSHKHILTSFLIMVFACAKHMPASRAGREH